MLSTPWLTDLASLIIVTMITAIMFGYLDSGKCIILKNKMEMSAQDLPPYCFD